MAHTYVPTTWINNKTQLNEANMNKIEQELYRLSLESGGVKEILEGPGIQVTPGTDESSVIVGLRSGSSKDNLLLLDKENGLILTLGLSYDPAERKLVLSSGSGWKTEVDFGVDRSIVNGHYDPETRNIVFDLSDETEVVVDMSKMKINWKYIESNTIRIIEDFDADEGISTFKMECKISEEEGNEITVKDDGLYSERTDWRFLGVSDESDGRWEFEEEIGNKYWYFESSKSVDVEKYDHVTKWRTIGYYDFGYRISTKEGNFLNVRDGKLYVTDELPEETALRLEVERLEEEIQAEKELAFRSNDSVEFINTVDKYSGKRYIKAQVRVSETIDNEIEVTSDGIHIPPYTPGPGKPDLTPYVIRVEELEAEFPRVKNKEIGYIKNNAKI